MENREQLRKIYTPQVIENDTDYCRELEASFDIYIKYITDNNRFNLSSDDINEIKLICSKILDSLKLYFEGNIQKATSTIKNILMQFKDSKFIVSNLDDSYAFRMVSRLNELHVKGHDYNHLEKSDLTFFRARASDTPLTKREEMSHIPVSKRELTSTERFCIAGIPCLYLCVSTFFCWKELNFQTNARLNCSAVKFNEAGKKLKILNLTMPFKLIFRMNDSTKEFGSSLQHDFIKIYPLVLATSYCIEQKDRNFKSEYVISQLIMHCLKDLEIDGVAYMSTRAKGEMDFPLNVCLALPAFDEKSLDETFELTEPMQLEKFINLNFKLDRMKRSFINVYYESKKNLIVDVSDITYFKNSNYSVFDDYLVNQEHKGIADKN